MSRTLVSPGSAALTITAASQPHRIAEAVAEKLRTGNSLDLEATGPCATVLAIEGLAHAQMLLAVYGLRLSFDIRLLNRGIPDNDETAIRFTVIVQPLL